MSRKAGDRFNDPNSRKKLLERIEEGWTFEKIEPMSTDEIFDRLNRLGVTVTPEDYKDYDRAEPILQQALDRPGLEDREDVLDRLESLRAERAQAGGKKRRKKR